MGYNVDINNELTKNILQWGKEIKNDEEFQHLKDYINKKKKLKKILILIILKVILIF